MQKETARERETERERERHGERTLIEWDEGRVKWWLREGRRETERKLERRDKEREIDASGL